MASVDGHAGADRIGGWLSSAGNDPGCEAARSSLELYIEAELDGRDAARLFPASAAHQDSCPACRADHDGLLDAMRDPGIGSRGPTAHTNEAKGTSSWV